MLLGLFVMVRDGSGCVCLDVWMSVMLLTEVLLLLLMVDMRAYVFFFFDAK